MPDADRAALVDCIAANPEAGVSLGGGLRQVRFAREGGGKRGGYRTVYVFGRNHVPIFLVTVFAKNEEGQSGPGRTGGTERDEQGPARPLRRPSMSAYDSIRQGLSEALAVAEGQNTGAVVHKVAVPAVDVAAIRASTGLSQGAFARSIGVAKGTLLNWEHGRRRPTGPAQVLLAMIARKPSLVSELLR